MLHSVGGGVYPHREQEKQNDTYRTQTLRGVQRADISHTAQMATLTTKLHRNISITTLLIYATPKGRGGLKRKLFGMLDGHSRPQCI